MSRADWSWNKETGMTRLLMAVGIFAVSAMAQTTLYLHSEKHPITGYLGADSEPGTALAAMATPTASGNAEVQLTDGGYPVAWISPAVAAPVTIKKAILFYVWGRESNGKANAGYYVRLSVYRNGQLLPDFTWGGPTAELANKDRARVMTITSGSMPKLEIGDRIVVRVYLKSSGGQMAAGHTVTTSVNGEYDEPGNSYIQFSEDIAFSLNP